LLSKWSIPPGTRDDKTVDSSAIEAWMTAVRIACEQSGHLRVAMSQLGHVLVSAPADSGGLWIHHAYAEILNEADAESMRRGYVNELFNSRGVHGFSAGDEEQKIAADYGMKADAVENQGYVRLATTLRELAQSYRYESEREATRDPFDD
jgi:hypothetical protein